MGWIKDMIFKILRIKPAGEKKILIQEPLTFQANVLKNLTWYRGDSAELEQFFKQAAYFDTDKTRFWASVPFGKVRKIHSGIVSMVVDRYRDLIISDMDGIDFGEETDIKPILDTWKKIEKENKFKKCIGQSVADVLASGDGAFKISIDESETYPILTFYAADKVDYKYKNGRLIEILYYTEYEQDKKTYNLEEAYGRGYICYKLFDDMGREVPLNSIVETSALEDTAFDGDFIMGEQLIFFESNKWKGRGKALFDTKTDPLDSLDEVLSQWLDAIRRGRVNRYIPEDMIPRDPETGQLMEPNDFDNSFIAIGTDGREGATNKIELSQGDILYEAYVNSYSSFMDIVLQGIISPATLGIDLKKTDNAQAQREKEKITIYTRNKIVDTLYEVIPEIVCKLMMVMDLMNGKKSLEYSVSVKFGEYAAPDFDNRADTVGKAKNYGIMSVDTAVEELYGDSKDEEWKIEEIKRIKEEQGITEIEEPAVNLEKGLENITEKDSSVNVNMLNGAQVTSLMNVIAMVKSQQLTRNEAISIITSTLGVTRENAETFIEDKL